jgi:hypothetical protein
MTKYNIHIDFLNYYSIINAIPQQWKVKIATGDYTIEIMNTNYKFSVEKILNTRNKLCKLVYSKMLHLVTEVPIIVFNKWNILIMT